MELRVPDLPRSTDTLDLVLWPDSSGALVGAVRGIPGFRDTIPTWHRHGDGPWVVRLERGRLLLGHAPGFDIGPKTLDLTSTSATGFTATWFEFLGLELVLDTLGHQVTMWRGAAQATRVPPFPDAPLPVRRGA
jgi:hypothetical protein